MKRVISGMMIMVWILTTVSGCDQNSTEIMRSDTTQASSTVDSDKVSMLEGEVRAAVLAENLLVPNVASFVDTLTNWGYAYRQINSLVFVQNHYGRVMLPPTGVTDKAVPDCSYITLLSADTLVWQVFENAAGDSTLHTAVLSAYRDGEVQSAFLEIDVASPELEFVRGGMLTTGGEVIDGQYARGLWHDYSVCLMACCAACAIGCLLSGPGWPACTAACCVDCFPVCAIHTMIAAIIDWF